MVATRENVVCDMVVTCFPWSTHFAEIEIFVLLGRRTGTHGVCLVYGNIRSCMRSR